MRSNHFLAPAKVLTIACGPNNTAIVSRELASGTFSAAVAVGKGASLAIGPFPRARIYSVDGDASLSIADATTIPAPLTYISASGAVAVSDQFGIITKAGVAALTLAAPTLADDGVEITITSTTAYAHTLTATDLIHDGVTGGAKDLATFAAFAGASITLRAVNLLWHVISSTAVTVSAAE